MRLCHVHIQYGGLVTVLFSISKQRWSEMNTKFKAAFTQAQNSKVNLTG